MGGFIAIHKIEREFTFVLQMMDNPCYICCGRENLFNTGNWIIMSGIVEEICFSKLTTAICHSFSRGTKRRDRLKRYFPSIDLEIFIKPYRQLLLFFRRLAFSYQSYQSCFPVLTVEKRKSAARKSRIQKFRKASMQAATRPLLCNFSLQLCCCRSPQLLCFALPFLLKSLICQSNAGMYSKSQRKFQLLLLTYLSDFVPLKSLRGCLLVNLRPFTLSIHQRFSPAKQHKITAISSTFPRPIFGVFL